MKVTRKAPGYYTLEKGNRRVIIIRTAAWVRIFRQTEGYTLELEQPGKGCIDIGSARLFDNAVQIAKDHLAEIAELGL